MDPELQAYLNHRISVLERIRRILIDNLDVRREPGEIDPDTPLFGTGLGLDSIDAVELLISLEVEFGVSLPDEIAGRAMMRTVNNLVDLVIDQAR